MEEYVVMALTALRLPPGGPIILQVHCHQRHVCMYVWMEKNDRILLHVIVPRVSEAWRIDSFDVFTQKHKKQVGRLEERT